MNSPVNNSTSLDIPYIVDIELDRSSDTPLYQQISKPLSELVMSGAVEPGRLIEDEVTMSNRLKISRPTARRALQELVNDGLLIRRRGTGTRVTPNHVHRQIGLTSLNDDLMQAGYKTQTKVLSYTVHFADAENAARLECDEGSELVTIERLRSVNDTPLAIMRNTISSANAPSLTDLSTYGLYECFSRKGISLASATQTIGAKVANDAEAKLLNLEPGAALLTMQRTAYSSSGEVIEFGSHAYNAAQYNVVMPLVAD
ncbi:DNA-binding GntR family transcriptional regulator [Arcanobacterium pluranimalium]|uniref:GntR family transcriptional regulator n=1 Tax=Arcanobacterium pluranimalium TaxID=108028 RepID=UPI00195CF7AF|nr:GntR family transcriptional regulator [Arcanobacterium pluranimalium]MBM7824680.1 DNA-binding GntR family transcriptional regulator [Arcanobacterium pluranimalium]